MTDYTPTPGQCCGTCRHANEEIYRGNDLNLTWCGAPVPDALRVAIRDRMLRTDGTDCPCYQPRDAERRERE